MSSDTKNGAAAELPVVELERVNPEKVSEEFITALKQAGARDSLVTALRKERTSDRPRKP